MKIQLSAIHESPHRLREVAKDESFYELVESLREQGLIQPIKVRPNNSGYEIVYGHRRTAAMRYLGWQECEAIVEQLSPEKALLESITENLQRKDLTIFEEAAIYKSLKDQGYTFERIAQIVSKSHGHISNRLSLLRLPPDVQKIIHSGNNQQVATTELGKISVDSASRISAAVSTPEEAIHLAQRVIEEKLTGMEIRELTSKLKEIKLPEDRQRLLENPYRSVETSKPFHTSNRTVSDQFHSKIIWNLKRIKLDDYSHFTIGYSQRSFEQVLELLELAKVSILVDARRNAVSQYKPEFSKTNLQNGIEAKRIHYLHIPELGIDSDERGDLAETHDYQTLFSNYELRLNPTFLKKLIGKDLENQRLAFLCVELDPTTCHRNRIALTLEAMGYLTLDL